MDGSPYLARPARSEAEVLAEFEGLPAVWPAEHARHQCGHLARIVIFLRWAAGQPRSFTDSDVRPDPDADGRFAMRSCITNGYLERVTFSRHPVSGLLIDHWRLSARGRAVVERAAEYERAGRVF